MRDTGVLDLVRRIERLVGRIEAGTPEGRDRALDGLRALAIAGVVLGHWLVTALVLDSGALRGASPLSYQPALTPVSWALQTLAVFFWVGGRSAAGGYAAARAGGAGYGSWVRGRLARLCRPVAPVLAVWSVAAVAMLALGAGQQTVYALFRLVLSPLWFLLVYAALTAATPLAARLHPGWPLAVVALADLVRYGLDGPAWIGWINVPAGWLVPYCLGAARVWDGPRARAAGWALLAGGGALTAGLVLWAGYPASMVGVPGAPVSNLSPPTLAAVAFGLAQCGAARLLYDPLGRVLRRPAVWAVVALMNLSAMTLFLWHQTAMMAVTALGLLAGPPLPGLHTVPADAGWLPARLAWLPVFALALLVCLAAFHAYERGPSRAARRGSSFARAATGVGDESVDGGTGLAGRSVCAGTGVGGRSGRAGTGLGRGEGARNV
ncbi:acyltransferase [Nonomuraea sp. SMC257]|uniref:Acyltransferase n=1 Tax=Nonomuraea montanisoli TaxID=2741721 RepID=A0A7Y6M716_9ACTN|nr:acyltransferase [Nonomuraea montanisoli]NUW36230.1 acyltransferase [Nonomuraea montanisoli]